jgi:ribosome-binding factor A
MYEETHDVKIARVYLVRIPKDETDQLEVKEVLQRAERVAAFAALANTRRLLQKAGVKV